MIHTLKKLCSVSAVIFVTSLGMSSVNAADIDPPVLEPVAEAYDWSGPYFGLQFGGAVDGDATASIVGGSSASTNVDGVLGGILGGYNFQKDNIVFGIDSDFSLTDISSGGGINSVDINTLSTARLRVGYAYDRFLPYVTGGLAYSFVDADSVGTGSDDAFHLGWTAGTGVEYAVTDRIHARLQYNYVDLGSESFNIGGNIVNGELDNLHIIRAGVSIKTGFIFDKIFRR